VDSELEVIHHEMEETRASLADKLEALESQVRGNVDAATHAVEVAKETVETTVETVQETVSKVQEKVKDTVKTVQEGVREAFDVQGHVRRYPWAMFGGAVAVGFVGGALLGPSRRSSSSSGSPWAGASATAPQATTSSSAGEQSFLSSAASAAAPVVSESLHEGLQLLRGLAMGSVMGLVRDMVQRVVPPNFTADATRWVDDLTTRLGGKPVSSSSGTAGQYPG